MAKSPVKPKQNSSNMFAIVVSVLVVLMIAIVAFSIASNKEEGAKLGNKIEISPAANVTAATVDGEIGEAALPAFVKGQPDPAVGQLAPKITTRNFNDESVTITPGEKPYVLAFLAHWCPHCQAEVPKIIELHEDGELPKEVEFIAVATSTNRESPNYPPSKWLSQEGWPWRAILDTQNVDIAKAYGLDGYPYMVYVNADGTIAQRTSGEVDKARILSSAKALVK